MGNWNNKSGVPCDDLCASFECGCLGDKTWKERHVKGVPVKMNQFQFYNRIRELPDGDSTEWATLKNGSPESGQSKDGIEIRFCNFRYKPEWLEKLENERKIHWLKTHQAL